MTRHRPFGITILAIVAGLAGVIAAWHTLQYLHIMPFSLGPVSFYGTDLWGAILWGINTLLLAWVVAMLWTMNPSGWLFLVLISAWNLFAVLLSIIGASSISAYAPAIVINGLVLIYCLLPNTRRAFGPPVAI